MQVHAFPKSLSPHGLGGRQLQPVQHPPNIPLRHLSFTFGAEQLCTVPQRLLSLTQVWA